MGWRPAWSILVAFIVVVCVVMCGVKGGGVIELDLGGREFVVTGVRLQSSLRMNFQYGELM